MPKTTAEKIDNIEIQMQQLANEKKRLMQQQKEADRKARTKRLIERGAILESMIPDADTFSNEQIKVFLEKTVANETARKILDGLSRQGGETASAESMWRVKSGGATATTENEVAERGAG